MSWLSDVVPTPAGPFTFEWDPKGKELVIKRRDVIYWTSGHLTNSTFENIDRNTGFLSVSNADEDYIMFTVSSNQFTPQYQRNFSRWQMKYDGNIVDDFTKQAYGGHIM
ncbi:hypothetical protein OIU77_015485 [Salix suchowensis]|uniref:Uncharacterized protein n=1 Tax=Salix suchowensis TaxID=1278906 RepID=A0ABQ8ZH50_9ROSI|nr:hypothetical protein OIU77_015485 [Salix suchowensis]